MHSSITSPVHSLESHAVILRNALGHLGHKLDEADSLKVISDLNEQCQYIGELDDSDERLKIAENFLDRLIAARETADYQKIQELIEEPYRENWFNEKEFKRGITRFEEDLGAYITRTHFGTLRAIDHTMEKFPKGTRHIWRGQFEKANVIIILKIYKKDRDYFLGDIRFDYK